MTRRKKAEVPVCTTCPTLYRRVAQRDALLEEILILIRRSPGGTVAKIRNLITEAQKGN